MKKLQLLLLLFAFLGSSCKTKKSVTRVNQHRSDTLIVKTEAIKVPEITEVLTIKDICDTITNDVVRFEKVFVQNGDSIRILTNEKNELEIYFKQRERTIDSLYVELSRYKEQLESYQQEIIIKKDIWFTFQWSVGALIVGGLIGYFRAWRFLKLI